MKKGTSALHRTFTAPGCLISIPEEIAQDSLVVSQSDVEQMCPGLKRAQSTRLFKNATKYAETHANAPPEDPNATPRSNTQEGSGSNQGTTPREDEEAVVLPSSTKNSIFSNFRKFCIC